MRHARTKASRRRRFRPFLCQDLDLRPALRTSHAFVKVGRGFSVGEIALRLFTTEANGYQRLSRARERLREVPPDFQTPPRPAMRTRLPDVHAVLYLLFNEGYLPVHADQAIRRELCDEGIRQRENRRQSAKVEQ